LPRDSYTRQKFTLEWRAARKLAKDYFKRFPKSLYETRVESWRELQSYKIEFVMKRLREPKAPA
jgi:CRISPR/Cas system-associated endoribonuclease Cas2